ncbi:MAG: anthranilate phosphoribosyltransferase [Candidatus Omnitrophota bacterium]|nr:anthranilate phosphoribosyltransferase [Candidatus Omnitrophota bacterium]
MDIRTAIKRAVCFEDLTERETHAVFEQIMGGKATPSQIAAFITALSMKGETVEEITGAAKVMREKAVRIRVSGRKGEILDTCGTGGSGSNTFNISTTVAFILAGCGVKVAKHGNRSASSHCGSADVLEELGVKIDVSPGVVERCINEINIGFLFAPLFHGAMKYAAIPRKEIGIRTIFNILGPLCNPASATCQVLGVFDEKLTETMAKVLKKLGSKRAYVVHGCDPLDEVTITGKTRISELRAGRVRSYYVTPPVFGVKKAVLKDIKGGTARQNARMIRDVLSGRKGPRRDVVLMNSSVGLMAAGKVRDFRKGVRFAAAAIDSGGAMEKLNGLIRFTNR